MRELIGFLKSDEFKDSFILSIQDGCLIGSVLNRLAQFVISVLLEEKGGRRHFF